MMQRAQRPERQYVSVYHVPDADREKEAGNRRMWSDPVKVKHWEERLDTDMHIFLRGSKFYCLRQVHLAENLPRATHTQNRVETTQIRAKTSFTYLG